MQLNWKDNIFYVHAEFVNETLPSRGVAELAQNSATHVITF